MATIPKNSRIKIIRKNVEKYRDEDFAAVNEFVKRLIAKIEYAFDDQRLLSSKVEEFLDEVRSVAITSIRRKVTICRDQEEDSCMGQYKDNHPIVSDTYENQGKRLENDLKLVFEEIEQSLEKLRYQLERKDRADSEITYMAKRAFWECRDNIVDEYQINSKKMINSIEKELEEYVRGLEEDKRERSGGPDFY